MEKMCMCGVAKCGSFLFGCASGGNFNLVEAAVNKVFPEEYEGPWNVRGRHFACRLSFSDGIDCWLCFISLRPNMLNHDGLTCQLSHSQSKEDAETARTWHSPRPVIHEIKFYTATQGPGMPEMSQVLPIYHKLASSHQAEGKP